MNKLRVFLACWSLCVFSAQAANPLVKFPSGDAAWIVDVSYPEPKLAPDAAGASGYVKQVEVSSKDGIRRNVLHFMDGSTSENWRLERDKLRIVQHPGHGGIYVIPDSDEMMSERNQVGFDETLFGWIRPEHFVGNVRMGEKHSLHYKANLSGNGKKTSLEIREAWIDAESGLPVLLQVGSALMTFRFLDAPTKILAMPAKMQTAVDRYRKSLQPVLRREVR